MLITRNSIETTPGPSDWFTGTVFVDTVAAPSEPSRLAAASVHFDENPRAGADQDEDRPRIAVVIGSTRPTRIGAGIAEWVMHVAEEESPLSYELIDLAVIDLPFLDEPLKAALREYEHEHTRA
jgi:hypothetical protein